MKKLEDRTKFDDDANSIRVVLYGSQKWKFKKKRLVWCALTVLSETIIPALYYRVYVLRLLKVQ